MRGIISSWRASLSGGIWPGSVWPDSGRPSPDQWGGGAAYRKWIPILWMPILLVTFIPLFYNWEWASRADDYATIDWAYDLLMSVEPYGVLFTNGDNDTFPLWYAQEIEGVRQDVTVIVLQYLYTDWYPRQIRDRTAPGRQRPFDVQFAAGIYSAGAPPDQSVSLATDEVLNDVIGGTLPEDLSLSLDSVVVTYPVRALPGSCRPDRPEA